jgi:hypothetical protein
VLVGATLWYWVLVQTVVSEHCRSVVAVAAAVWYCDDVQTVSPAQTRFEVQVAAVVSNSVLLSHVVRSRQTRSVVVVGAVCSN